VVHACIEIKQQLDMIDVPELVGLPARRARGIDMIAAQSSANPLSCPTGKLTALGKSKAALASGGMSVEIGFLWPLMFALRRHPCRIRLSRNAARPKLLPLQIVLREWRLDAIRIALPRRIILPAHRVLPIFVVIMQAPVFNQAASAGRSHLSTSPMALGPAVLG
jgi:hypothetical protein